MEQSVYNFVSVPFGDVEVAYSGLNTATSLMRAGFVDRRYTKLCDKFPPTIPPTHLN